MGKEASPRGGHDGHTRHSAGLASPADRAEIRRQPPAGTRPTENIRGDQGSGGANGQRKPQLGLSANPRSAVQSGSQGGPWHDRRNVSPAWIEPAPERERK